MSFRKKIIIPTLLIIIAIIGSVFFWLGLFKGSVKNFANIEKINADKVKGNGKDGSEKKTVSILFFGDIMADRYIRQVIDKKGVDYIFNDIRELLKSHDLAVANLEGPITDKNSVSVNTIPGQKNHLVFTFDPILAPALAKENIKIVNIGNNHISNFGPGGIAETIDNLGKNGIEYFGDTGENKFLVRNIGGIRVGFINYNQFVSGSAEKVLKNIQNIRPQADIVVVFAHWGIEYETDPPESVKNLAHNFIDNGVDLIIGTHPHVVEPAETYKNKRIYYSLGNFVFDQYFSAETKKGLAVEVKINPEDKNLDFRDINLTLETNGQTVIN